MTSLSGRTALVSGASRGIGLAIARVLVSEGARVYMLARSAEVLAREAAALGPFAVPLPCDLTVAAEIERGVEQVRSVSGAPDIVVSNAGVFPFGAADGLSPDTFDAALQLNLGSSYRLLQAFLSEMRARRSGHLVTIGSIADRAIYPGNAAYAATKFGARALHEVLRAELRGSGVRTTLISPGPVDTGLWDALDPVQRQQLPPPTDMLHDTDVADAVCWAVTRSAHVNVDELRLTKA